MMVRGLRMGICVSHGQSKIVVLANVIQTLLPPPPSPRHLLVDLNSR